MGTVAAFVKRIGLQTKYDSVLSFWARVHKRHTAWRSEFLPGMALVS